MKTLITLAALAFALGCDGGPGDRMEVQPEDHWVRVPGNERALSPGPYIYSMREPHTLADGTQVVCLSTHNALWCKEAQ